MGRSNSMGPGLVACPRRIAAFENVASSQGPFGWRAGGVSLAAARATRSFPDAPSFGKPLAARRADGQVFHESRIRATGGRRLTAVPSGLALKVQASALRDPARIPGPTENLVSRQVRDGNQ